MTRARVIRENDYDDNRHQHSSITALWWPCLGGHRCDLAQHHWMATKIQMYSVCFLSQYFIIFLFHDLNAVILRWSLEKCVCLEGGSIQRWLANSDSLVVGSFRCFYARNLNMWWYTKKGKKEGAPKNWNCEKRRTKKILYNERAQKCIVLDSGKNGIESEKIRSSAEPKWFIKFN